MLNVLNAIEIHKLYLVNVCSKTDINICFFFFYYETSKGDYIFMVTKAFPLHWKKHLSKKLIDYILHFYSFSYWFSIYCNLESINLEEEICKQFILLPINIRNYNV